MSRFYDVNSISEENSKVFHQSISFIHPLKLKWVDVKIVIWIYDTFDNNFGIDNDFGKYLKGYCW